MATQPLIQLTENVLQHFSNRIQNHTVAKNELTVEFLPEHIHEVCLELRDVEPFKFDLFIDVCGVDYLDYGISQWQTESTTRTGFSRAVAVGGAERTKVWNKPRFAVVYHLLSTTHNQRIRLKVFVEGEPPKLATVVDIWEAANWYEREAFDLYGILFDGHPDLRRILTDYGFIGHPFRKDFPLIGHVEMRYDATLQRCVYEPVSIQPRTLVPKIIRQDNRYLDPIPPQQQGESNG